MEHAKNNNQSPQPLSSQQSGQLSPSYYTIEQSDEVEIVDEGTFKREIMMGRIGNYTGGGWGKQLVRQEEDVLEDNSVVGMDGNNKTVKSTIEQSIVEISSSAAQIQSVNTSSQQQQSQTSHLSQQFPTQRLCCRPYFTKHQPLPPQSRSLQYKHYNMPTITPTLQLILAKAITAFLNSNGGIILIGVHQSEDFQRKVVGGRYSQAGKENVLRKLREILEMIRPIVVIGQWVEVGFVPVVTKKNNGAIVPIRGLYVIKVAVKQGDPLKIYTVMNPFTGYEEVCIRTENQVLTYKQMSQGLSFLQDRLKISYKLETHYPHDNPCNIDKQKTEFNEIMKGQNKKKKKEFKTNTKLSSENNQENNTQTRKKIIRITGQLTPAELQKLKEFLNEFDRENPKIKDTQQKDSTEKQVQKFISSTCPFLFKQVNQEQEEKATEPIDY